MNGSLPKRRNQTPGFHGSRLALAVVVACLPVSLAFGGSFIGSLAGNSVLADQDFILHPEGYAIDEGFFVPIDNPSVTVNLCIVPGTPNADSMVTPVANIAAKMTAKKGRSGNLSTGESGDAVPFTQWDFESVALHEVGHCLGLGHVNAATESGLPQADRDFTKASTGADATFDLGLGADGRRGSKDDQRDDDVSVHWFRTTTNNPCADPGTDIFDSTTYTVDGALPAGSDFPANADKNVCNDLGVPNTEAIMQQGSPNGESQRFLGHDGEAMLRLAMSGLDETQGTDDDYSLTVKSLGISDSADCDINLAFDNTKTGFAVCQINYYTGVNFPDTPNHGVIATANAYFNTGAVTWFFNSSSPQYSVGGSVSGLAGTGLVLQNNAGDDLPVGGNGDFTFVTPVTDGEDYDVTVKTQPGGPNQSCSVESATGTVLGEAITSVVVSCVTDGYTIGGSVSGLLGGTGLVLQNNLGDDLPITANGDFTFTTPVGEGASYAVTIKTQPSGPSQICTVGNGSGTANSDITSVTITCGGILYAIGGTVSGLDGTGLVLQNNLGDDLPITGNGSFTFLTPLSNGAGYDVTVDTQPTNLSQDCQVSMGSGTVNSSDITNVMVSCQTNSFTVGGDVSGLVNSGLVLQNNSGDDLDITGNGSFTFATPLTDGNPFDVQVLSQPEGIDPGQKCTVTGGSGNLAGANVTNVSVTCENTCNAILVSGEVDASAVTREACEVLVVGSTYTAETSASVTLSSGVEVVLLPEFQVDQGATMDIKTCGQSLCEESPTPMPLGCHSCVDAICAQNPSCCDDAFGASCVSDVEAVCGLVCE